MTQNEAKNSCPILPGLRILQTCPVITQPPRSNEGFLLDATSGYKSSLMLPAILALALLVLAGCQSPVEDQQADATIPDNATGTEPGLTEQQDLLNLPGPPSGIRLVVPVEGTSSQCQLVWQGTRDDTISGYNIYQLNSPKNWSLIGFMALRKEDSRNRGEYRFSKDIAASGTFAVAAVNNKGTPGPKSPAVHR